MKTQKVLQLELIFIGSPLVGIPTKAIVIGAIGIHIPIPSYVIWVSVGMLLITITFAYFRIVRKDSLLVRICKAIGCIQRENN
ncbi:MAG: hypothetical protein H6765_07835 [Candidatus Peribacteria bacterium]|nr:MAG: hypothetical protein H6765_07835 [Candidatus Peribacteria bacterium]